MSTFLCKNGVRKEYFLTPTFIIEPFFYAQEGTLSYGKRYENEGFFDII